MSYSFENKIRFSETADREKLSVGNIIDYMQDCTNYHSESLGVGIKYQLQTGRAWILNSWQIRINGDIRLGDTVRTTTWPCGFDKVFGYRNFTMANAAKPEELLVEAESTWIIMDVNKGRIAKIGQEDKEMYLCEPSLSEDLKKTKILPGAEYTKQTAYIVRRYQLDINGHMNNSWYVKIAEEYVPQDRKIIFVRVEYKKSARLGDEIIPFVCDDNFRYLIELRDRDGNNYAVVEFSVDAAEKMS